MKILSGSELAGFIKERQAKAVRGLRQAHLVKPKLAIVVTTDDPVIEIYIRLKKSYGSDILIDVEIYRTSMDKIKDQINSLNQDDSVHAIIVQLPLKDISKTDEVVSLIKPEKDVDSLGPKSNFDPATPTAILWLLAGYGIDLKSKRVVVVGRGKLVGEPLTRILENSGVNVVSCDKEDEIVSLVKNADVIITATGSSNVITSEMIPINAVVVDAGVTVEKGRSVGDLADDVYQREDLTITPKKGGVGPLTVCALFDNVIKASKNSSRSDNNR